MIKLLVALGIHITYYLVCSMSIFCLSNCRHIRVHSSSNLGDNSIVLDGESHFVVPVSRACIADTPRKTKDYTTVVKIEAIDKSYVESFLICDSRGNQNQSLS